MADFRAFVAERRDGEVDRGVRTVGEDFLMPGEVTVRVAWSSVNYKDGLATVPKGNVARISPLVPGVDLAGEVVASEAPEVEVGEAVVVHGYDLGVAHHGGYAELARVPAAWVVPLPRGLTARRAMAIGTAGFTAALSVHQLEQHGCNPDGGPVLVTGASGGVGSTAVGILARRGYEVVASTGKADSHDFLRALGAASVLDRSETSAESPKPLEKERWSAAVDCVGGSTLAYVLRTLRYGAAVAASGLTGGPNLPTTVFPFILRGVALLGVDSVQLPMEQRRTTWARLAGDLAPVGLDADEPGPAVAEALGPDGIVTEVGLEDLPGVLDAILAGRVRGRTVVRVGG